MQEKLENDISSKIKYAGFIFIICSVFGWILEVIYRSAVTHSLFIPGFLLGPYCPIYGFGAIIVVFLCGSKNKLTAFLKVFILTSVLEYFISFFFEHVYNQILWDYTELPFSIGKRISLSYSLVWGMLGLASPIRGAAYFKLLQKAQYHSQLYIVCRNCAYLRRHHNKIDYLLYLKFRRSQKGPAEKIINIRRLTY